MVTYQPTFEFENVGNLQFDTFFPHPEINAGTRGYRPLGASTTSYGTTPSFALERGPSATPVEPRVGYWYGKWTSGSPYDTWELTQGFAESESTFLTQDGSVVEDKVLFTGTDVHFPCTVTQQAESWLMIVCAIPAQQHNAGTAVSTHASVDTPLNVDEVALYESADCGATWQQKCVMHTLENRNTSTTWLGPTGDIADATKERWPGSTAGAFSDPSSIYIVGPDTSTWVCHIPCISHNMEYTFIDCDGNPDGGSWGFYWWSTLVLTSTDYGETWSPASLQYERPNVCLLTSLLPYWPDGWGLRGSNWREWQSPVYGNVFSIPVSIGGSSPQTQGSFTFPGTTWNDDENTGTLTLHQSATGVPSTQAGNVCLYNSNNSASAYVTATGSSGRLIVTDNAGSFVSVVPGSGGLDRLQLSTFGIAGANEWLVDRYLRAAKFNRHLVIGYGASICHVGYSKAGLFSSWVNPYATQTR